MTEKVILPHGWIISEIPVSSTQKDDESITAPTLPISNPGGSSTPISSSPSQVWSWYDHYIEQLTYSPEAIDQIKERTKLISNLINESVKRIGDTDVWGDGRTRKGLVVGSIQSGKTASMLGVLSDCLDNKTDIVVLLSGTKVSLMQQTVERMYSDLIPPKWNKYAFVQPPQRESNVHPTKIGWTSGMNKSTKRRTTNKILRALKENKKIILGVMKQKDHLIHVSSLLENAISEFSKENDRKLHMLIVDDESDDASILDIEDQKSTPTRICRLWTGKKRAQDYHITHNENLYATYVGYTATPQANILQDFENPLYPSNFIYALKTPHFSLISGDESIYLEPKGVESCYTGGEIFYNLEFEDKDAKFANTEYMHDQVIDLTGPIRCYLIGAAIHILDNGGKKPPEEGKEYNSMGDAKNEYIEPFTMVFHPSAEKKDHFGGRSSIIKWINSGPIKKVSDDDNADLESSEIEEINTHVEENLSSQEESIKIEIPSFEIHLKEHDTAWEDWIHRFNKTAAELNIITTQTVYSPISHSWIEIKKTIIETVLPCLKIKVLNSGEEADEKPKFEPWKSPEKPNTFISQSDCLTIFVAGNVLGRGLTIEGLRVTAFQRSSATPAQDTQMQMQRWYGYRGSFLPFIRLFLSEKQLNHFTNYHKSDVVMKNILLSKETEIKVDEIIDFQPDILTDESTVPTQKTAISKLPLHPGRNPAFMIFDEQDATKEFNLDSLNGFVALSEYTQLDDGKSRKIGYYSNKEYTVEEVIDFLDKLKFDNHKPGKKHPEYKRWEQYNRNYKLGHHKDTLCKSFSDDVGNVGSISSNNSPYTISAYLKLWKGSNQINRSFVFAPENRTWDGSITPPNLRVILLCGISKDSKDFVDQSKVKHTLDFSIRGETNFWGNSGGSANRYDDKLVDYHISASGDPPIQKSGSSQFKGYPLERYVQTNHSGLLVIRLLEDKGVPSLAFGFSLPIDGPAHLRANN
jgi:hypothetical protein